MLHNTSFTINIIWSGFDFYNNSCCALLGKFVYFSKTGTSILFYFILFYGRLDSMFVKSRLNQTHLFWSFVRCFFIIIAYHTFFLLQINHRDTAGQRLPENATVMCPIITLGKIKYLNFPAGKMQRWVPTHTTNSVPNSGEMWRRLF